MIRRGVLAVSVLWLAGCRATSERAPDERWKGTADTLAGGKVRITNPGEGVWSEDHRWHIAAELRVGGAKAGAAMFGEIVGVAATPNGEIIVADRATQELRVFDASGRYLSTLAGKGAAPGELSDIIGLALGPNHRLWVADAGNARYTYFETDGTYIKERPRLVVGGIRPWVAGFGIDRNLYDATFHPRADGGTDFSFYRIDPGTGTLLAELPALTYRPPKTAISEHAVPPALAALIARFTFAFDPNGYLWFGTTDRYEIIQRTWRGDTIRIIQLDAQRIPVSEAEKDSVERALARTAGNDPRPWGRPDIPNVKPAFVRIFAGGDSTLIVQPSAKPDEEGRIFDVFDPEGRYLGRATSDVAFITFPVAPTFTKEFVYGVTATKSGAQQVVRARIHRGPVR